LSESAKLIDILIEDPTVVNILGDGKKLVNGSRTGYQGADESRPVTLQDRIALGSRQFLVVKVDGSLEGTVAVFEVPAPEEKILWFWSGKVGGGGIEYAPGRLGQSTSPILFVSKTETTDGDLTIWILDPSARRTTRMFKDEQAYHGRFFVADIDG